MKINVFLISFLVIFVFIGFVSAQYYGGYGSGFFGGTEQVIDSIVRNLAPILQALLGGNDWTGYLLFEKTLLFILITIIVGLVLTQIPVFSGLKHKGILRFIAVIIGLLAVRNLNYIWIGTILVQYQVLFIAVAGILPFLIYWAFVSSFKGPENSWIRKIMWCFYAIVYLGLWITTELEAYESVYLWGAIGAFVYAFFIDESLMKWIAMRDAKLGQTARRDEMIASLKKEIEETRKLEAAGHLSKDSADRIVKNKIRVVESLLKS
ncbi:MAG: hypothetical protein ACP5NS_03895 [Candidatus Pacearchaeota archaeon]